ncbi:hypothetical protein LTS18_001127, partial [Coniosporium uncinatum]
MTEEQAEVLDPPADPQSAYVSSPVYMRGGTYNELQGVSGVYPTPPDGIAPQHAGHNTSGSDHLTVESTAAGPSPYAIADSQAILNDLMDVDQKGGQTSFDSRGSVDFMAAINNATDDLFGDMDEDFAGPDLNEADFDDFFDEPDGAPLAPGATITEAVAETPMVSTSAEEADNFEVAVENASPDLMSSLEKALGESDQPKDDSEDMSKQDLLLVEPEHAQANAKPMLDEEQHSSNNELLVSPNRAGDDIVERPEYGSAVSRRHSVFDPVSFGKAVTDVDAKYADRGIFGFDPFRATRPRRPSRPAHNQAGSPLIPQ